MTEKRWLSKSQINTYIQCPRKWKHIYIDEIQSISSPQQNRGKDIHSKIEKFYNSIIIKEDEVTKERYIEVKKEDEDLKKFVEFENKRLKDCKELKFFNPIFQELKLSCPELMLRGVIDAVYINPEDNKAVIIDWKTGHYNSKAIDDYRFELAVYKMLFEKSKRLDIEVGYWGIFFTDIGKLFFEKVDEKYIKKAEETIENVRQKIDEEDYRMKPSFWCRWCQFREKCGGGNYVN